MVVRLFFGSYFSIKSFIKDGYFRKSVLDKSKEEVIGLAKGSPSLPKEIAKETIDDMQTNINNTSINQSLLNAYSSASYHVYTKPAFIIKINQYSADLESLYVLHHKNTAAFITAFNPYSQALDLNENHKRNDSLKEAIELLELSYTKGDGRCGESNEMGEESFLIIGISKEQSIQLGTESEQNAIVFCDKDAIPQLLLLK